MSEYVSLTVDQLVRRRQNDCRTQLFINKVADPYAKAPPQETGPETHVAAMDIDPASHDEPIIKSEPNDNFEVAAVPVVHEGGADVNTMDTDMDMADMDLEIVDMEDIPLSDPIDEIIEREYDFVPEFPEEGDSDMNFDVPSPKELSTANQPLEPARPLAWPWTTLTSYARHQNQTALGRVGRFF
ncbi:hypothetical protein Sste5346_009616 [Sporothrix stenoceras]|uniref:Uncharacterized protein n=1 Tax=Sporothrix stenoceras TaxID=5173 RepID=A0ABR3YJ41_9PEZI